MTTLDRIAIALDTFDTRTDTRIAKQFTKDVRQAVGYSVSDEQIAQLLEKMNLVERTVVNVVNELRDKEVASSQHLSANTILRHKQQTVDSLMIDTIARKLSVDRKDAAELSSKLTYLSGITIDNKEILFTLTLLGVFLIN